MAVEAVQKRLAVLVDWLGGRDYLEGRFTAGDLLMTTVLRILPELFAGDPRLKAYVERCTARPAFQRALNAQLADFKQAA